VGARSGLWRSAVVAGGVGGGLALVVLLGGACGVRYPEGYGCSSSDQCENGLACLSPLGSGCDAQGQCSVPQTGCNGTFSGLIVCACAAAPLDLTCLPPNAELSQPTATGAVCMGDGGPDAGALADAPGSQD
jgi:hypothetical protein